MKKISHRGNLNGPNPEMENRPDYIKYAISQGFDVEVDVWGRNGIKLGHDFGQYEVDFFWLIANKDKLLFHCKDEYALSFFVQFPEFHYVSHQNDPYVVTSKNYIFTLPGNSLFSRSILVMPEFFNYNYSKDNCYGVVTDICNT
jgi:hypothetical protein